MTETVALKEWSLALRALADGDQIVLLRKGGIVEETGAFDIVSGEFLLYPTFYHQDPGILKPRFHSRLQQEVTESPAEVTISLYATLSDVIPITDPECLEAISTKHIWTTSYTKDRFYWKSDKPLSLLLLRVFRLHHPSKIRVRREYGGCLSWIELAEPVNVGERSAVLNDEDFDRERTGILDAVSTIAG